MKPWKLIVAFVAVFLAGTVVGALSVLHFMHPPFGKPPSAAEISSHIMRELTAAVKLTPEQTAKIEPIVARNAEDLIAFHRELGARVQATLDTSDREIEALLDPEQKIQFETFRAQRPPLPRAP